jgi:hypothetical protein
MEDSRFTTSSVGLAYLSINDDGIAGNVAE